MSTSARHGAGGGAWWRGFWRGYWSAFDMRTWPPWMWLCLLLAAAVLVATSGCTTEYDVRIGARPDCTKLDKDWLASKYFECVEASSDKTHALRACRIEMEMLFCPRVTPQPRAEAEP